VKKGRAPRDTLYLEGEDAELLGRRLAAWCMLHQVQLQDIARELQVSRWQLSRYISGERPMRLDTALEICELTGMGITGDSVSLTQVGTWHQKHAQLDSGQLGDYRITHEDSATGR
jgi:transcriptional regulator with XRE-family HTH domain